MSIEPTQPQSFSIPKEGDVLAGKYRIERVLGRGGTGIVVAAQHETLRQRVAMKFLLPESIRTPEATERFLREARAAVAIQSEHVARVIDVGTLETGAPYMVMELLNGSDLGAVQKQRGPMPIMEAVDYVLQACEAIAEAHSIGIIHRDLKPANLFLTSRADGSPLVKVLDFGLSKAPPTTDNEASLTKANVVMGSPFFMSPEQIRGLKGVDARSDVWSIGVVLYHLLAGVRPFEADSLSALFMIIGSDEATPLTAHRPDVPAALSTAVMGCLVKDVDGRTQTIAALARSLAPFGSPGSQVSVERIHRILRDNTPFVRLSSSADLSGVVPTLSAGAADAVLSSVPPPAGGDPNDASAQRASSPSAVTPHPGARSASMPAIAASVIMPRSTPHPSRPPRAPELSSGAFRAATIGVVALISLGVIGLGVVLRRNAAPHGAAVATLSAASAPAAAAAAPPVQTAEPSPEVTSASIVASASASAAAPASEAPKSSAAPVVQSSARGAKGHAPAAKASGDPFDRWR